jgi:hypothetical protein
VGRCIRRGTAAIGSRLVVAGVALALLSGCGNSRTPAPQIGGPAPPEGFRVVNLPVAGARISVPRNWSLLATHSPLQLVLDTSGDAVIALWRYPLHGSAPQGAQQLQLARVRLIASSRARDKSLRVINSGVIRIAGAPAITLEADAHLGSRKRRVFSTHLFHGSEELVLEEYAPAQSCRSR